MLIDHITSHTHHQQLDNDNTLHVIGVISNPIRYQSRYRLYREWEKRMLATPHVNLITIEIAFGQRHHEVTFIDNKNHYQLRSNQEIWHKENMINIGEKILPRNWKYLAWIDCDVFFRDKRWAQETLHALQHFHVIQPWSDCMDLGAHGEVLTHFKSFGNLHLNKAKIQPIFCKDYPFAHTGFAWACTREFWENTHGLIDFAILGSGDHHMSWGLINKMEQTFNKNIHDGYKQRCMDWAKRAFLITKGNVGYIPGRIEHKFHGIKAKRRYKERWDILIDHRYNPVEDLCYDEQGLIYLHTKKKLLFDIAHYMRERHEDYIE